MTRNRLFLIGVVLIAALLLAAFLIAACQTQPNQIFIEVDGGRQSLTTEATTVRAALAEANVVLEPLDKVSPDLYVQLEPGMVIADIGAGTGNYADALAEKGYRIKAIEPSEEMRKQSKPNNNVDWLDGTAENIPLKSNSVDILVSRFSLSYWKNPKNVMSEINRVLKPGGKFILEALNNQFPNMSDNKRDNQSSQNKISIKHNYFHLYDVCLNNLQYHLRAPKHYIL